MNRPEGNTTVDLIETSFFLSGDVPGKANRRRNGINRATGKPITFLPKEVKAVLTAMELQARAKWRGRPPLTDVFLNLTFHVSNLASDSDNRDKSCRDILRKAGVIHNDSMAHIRRVTLEHDLVAPGQEGVWVFVSGVPYRKTRRAAKKRAA